MEELKLLSQCTAWNLGQTRCELLCSWKCSWSPPPPPPRGLSGRLGRQRRWMAAAGLVEEALAREREVGPWLGLDTTAGIYALQYSIHSVARCRKFKIRLTKTPNYMFKRDCVKLKLPHQSMNHSYIATLCHVFCLCVHYPGMGTGSTRTSSTFPRSCSCSGAATCDARPTRRRCPRGCAARRCQRRSRDRCQSSACRWKSSCVARRRRHRRLQDTACGSRACWTLRRRARRCTARVLRPSGEEAAYPVRVGYRCRRPQRLPRRSHYHSNHQGRRDRRVEDHRQGGLVGACGCRT